jgi:acyl carrier protein
MAEPACALRDVVARALKVPPSSILDTTSPETLRRWDSLRHIEVMTAVEDAYGVRFSTAEIVGATSVGEIRRLLRDKGIEAA